MSFSIGISDGRLFSGEDGKSSKALGTSEYLHVAQLIYMPFGSILSNQNFVVTRTTFLYYFYRVSRLLSWIYSGPYRICVFYPIFLLPFDTTLSGWSKLGVVVISLLNIIKADFFPVIERAAEQYVLQWYNASCKLFSAIILDLKVWIECSASPFVLGYCGADNLWWILFPLQNWLNVSEVNWVPLSDTTICGILYLANSDHKIPTVRSFDVLDIWMTSGHLVIASTRINHMWP